MNRTDRHRFALPRLLPAALVALLMLLPGCIGGSANPSRLGNLPPGNIIRTHAKPPLRGNYHNFDRHAKQLTVTPVNAVNQVQTQHILIATVCDDEGNGRRNRRVEWHVTGKGHIVEVDESGILPGRGYMVDDKYAVSYTNYRAHTLTRGNDDPSDDIQLKPGQTWCVITSAEEGETQVTCYAPGIYDWEKHKVFAVKHWVDAKACFPPCAVNATGQPHPMVTRVTRPSDGSPAAGYRVRYRIVDGPPAVLDPGGAQQLEVVSDQLGNASVTLRQLQPIPGINRVSIEVVRPGDTPTAKEITIACHEMTKTWVSPQLVIQKMAPAMAAVGGQIPYQIVVTNTGSIASRGGTIRDTLPDTLQFLHANPMATQQGRNLLWNFGPLQPGQSVAVQFACQATAAGTVTNCAEAVMAEGSGNRACATTQVVTGSLAVAKTGPATGVIGQPITFQITVTNQGAGPASNVIVTDAFDPGLVHETGSAPVQLQVGVLAPGEARSLPIVLTPNKTGRLCNRVSARADGGLTAEAEHCIEITQPSVEITKTGPAFALVGAPVDFEITVRNTGSTVATNVLVRDQSPPQLQPQQLSEGGALQGQFATWNLGNLQPGEQRILRLRAIATTAANQVCNVAVLTADGIPGQQAPACLDIRGIPALLTEVIDRYDPVPVGAETTYTIQITNQGTSSARDVQLTCIIPGGVEYVDAEAEPSINIRYDENAREVIFSPFAEIAARKRLIYQVQVKGVRPGDVRFEARVSSRELKEPVIMQQSTQIYDPNDPTTGQMNGAGKVSTDAVDAIANRAEETPVEMSVEMEAEAIDRDAPPAAPLLSGVQMETMEIEDDLVPVATDNSPAESKQQEVVAQPVADKAALSPKAETSKPAAEPVKKPPTKRGHFDSLIPPPPVLPSEEELPPLPE